MLQDCNVPSDIYPSSPTFKVKVPTVLHDKKVFQSAAPPAGINVPVKGADPDEIAEVAVLEKTVFVKSFPEPPLPLINFIEPPQGLNNQAIKSPS